MNESKEKILVVDDERLNIQVLNDLLKSEYRIMAALSGHQALKAATSDNPPDLILLDVVMPEMDGYEVCLRLKSNPLTRDIPVIFVTGRSEEHDEELALELGAVDYVAKPVSPAIVRARVRTHMALRRHLTELKQANAIISRQKARMQHELDVAQHIQLSMLPSDGIGCPGTGPVAVCARMHAAREVGGDFYDYFPLPPHHLGLTIGDVSGKGVPAALFMAITKALINARAMDDPSTASILQRVNQVIGRNNDTCMFVTVFLAILDLNSGHMIYSNAGHLPPLLMGEGGIERLQKRHGPVLGPNEQAQFQQARMHLQPGDTLLLYTDGVTEALNPDGALFGEPRLERLLQQDVPITPETLVRRVTAAVDRFAAGAEQSDDITLLSLTYHGTEHQAAA